MSKKQSAWSWWYLLFLIPFVILLWPPLYNRAEPSFYSIPFFYWFQLLMVFVTAGLLGFVYWATLVPSVPEEETWVRPKPEENNWYRLMTICGADERVNRETWNRAMANFLSAAQISKLIADGRHTPAELIPTPKPQILQQWVKATGKPDGCPIDPDGDDPYGIDLLHIRFPDHFLAAGYIFPFQVNFSGSEFNDSAGFSDGVFFADVFFTSVVFARWAHFEGTRFHGRADFSGAECRYIEASSFAGATFEGETSFERVAFRGEINFNKTSFKDETSFEDASFVFAPKFFEAKLFEGTVWRGVKWPLPSAKYYAGKYLDAYERLKMEMERLKKHEAELDFFALELQCKRTLLGGIAGFPITLYGLFCDYGRSYGRPLAGLVLTVLLGAIVMWACPGQPASFSEIAALALANTFAVLGFRREFFDPEVLKAMTPWLKAAGAAQMTFGMIFLFFFALAIRNRFRMK